MRRRGEREAPRGSRGREKAGENGGSGAEERAGEQHPRSPPHRSILCPPPCTGELASSLSNERRAPHASSLLLLTAPLRTPVAHGRCRVLRTLSVFLFSPSVSLYSYPIPFFTYILAFTLKGKRARGSTLILSRPSQTMLEHGPSPLRGISLSGRDPRDGIVSMHRGCRHDRTISRARIDAGVDG